MLDLFYTIFDIFKENFYWQLIWLIAFIVSIYNFLFCKNKKFIFFTMVASLVWWIHFYSIGLIAAALINFVDVTKNALALKYEKSNKIVISYVVLYVIIWFITYDWLVTIIPTLTALLGTYLVFYVRWVKLNIGFMFVIILWSIYNFLWHSIGWLATDITLFITGTIWILKIIISDKKQRKKEIKKEAKNIKKEIEII